MFNENDQYSTGQGAFSTNQCAAPDTRPRRRKHRAALTISVEKLGRLLNLRDGIEIVAGNYDARCESFELFLAGDLGFVDLPLKSRGAEIFNVPLRDVVDLD
jgi:hypothetical protein